MVHKKEKEVSLYKPHENISPTFDQELCSGTFLAHVGLAEITSQQTKERVMKSCYLVNIEKILNELRTWAVK